MPSDDQSCTTNDDQDYLPLQKAITVVEENNEACDDTGNANKDLADILNSNDNEIVKLPSTYKVSKHLKSFNKNVFRSLFSSNPTSSSTIVIGIPEFTEFFK